MLSYVSFFNDTATTEIYTLSLHDALPIFRRDVAGHDVERGVGPQLDRVRPGDRRDAPPSLTEPRSEEHTSELQSRVDLVCRLLLEKKKKNTRRHYPLQTNEESKGKTDTAY